MLLDALELMVVDEVVVVGVDTLELDELEDVLLDTLELDELEDVLLDTLELELLLELELKKRKDSSFFKERNMSMLIQIPAT